jgi:nucleoid-associated protein YgaU
MNTPLFSSEGVTYPWIRTRVASTDCLTHVLTYADVHTIDGSHPLEMLALKAYGESRYWFVIADVNPIRRPQEWNVGDKILVPREKPSILIRETGE